MWPQRCFFFVSEKHNKTWTSWACKGQDGTTLQVKLHELVGNRHPVEKPIRKATLDLLPNLFGVFFSKSIFEIIWIITKEVPPRRIISMAVLYPGALRKLEASSTSDKVAWAMLDETNKACWVRPLTVTNSKINEQIYTCICIYTYIYI